MKLRGACTTFFPALRRANLRPTFIVRDIASITPLWMIEHGFKGIATDLDGVFMDHDEPNIDPARAKIMQDMKKAGFQVGLLSNVSVGPREDRVDAAAKAMGIAPSAVVKPSDCGGHIKPSRVPFMLLANKMSLDPSKIVYVGDQMLKDVLGANVSGYGATILVRRYGENDHPVVARYQRPIETSIRRSMRGIPNSTADFPEVITKV